MFVIKRDGRRMPIKFDKIVHRINHLSIGLEHVDAGLVAQSVITSICNGISTVEIDNLASETCASMVSIHPDYGKLAANICASNIQKRVGSNFATAINRLYNYRHNERSTQLLSEDCYQFILKHIDELSMAIKHTRDFNYDYHGIKTLEKSYLLRVNNDVAETPQYMIMRIACGIHYRDNNPANTIETYELMSQGYFTHATPTMFNSGTQNAQMASCFLIATESDSIDGIFATMTKSAKISKGAGGVGFSISNVRSEGSYIAGTNGHSNGIVPMLRVYNDIARYVDQGGGRRKGSFAPYLEMWHPDIIKFLSIKLQSGVEELRARDLFPALWVCDLFMKRVEADQIWSLFCPNDCPDLIDLYGEAFEQKYTQYESQNKQRSTVNARDVWQAILKSQTETGVPYMLYKDACNTKSNQKNLGTIRSSNLCCEIVQYSSANETAVCNLASIGLPKFVIDGSFDYDKLVDVVGVIVRNLNKIIDNNCYPITCTRLSNLRHRPIGIGVQGLADVFAILDIPFDSEEAQQINKNIFESIYYGACVESHRLAVENGPYNSFNGSPMQNGIFQFDMWHVKPSSRYDWDDLRQKIMQDGVRNSLMTALMPTASTAQILGNSECFEPYTSMLYVRRTLSGEFVCINKYLVAKLTSLGLWNIDMKNSIVANNGSIQNIDIIPQHIKHVFRTVWEISQKNLIDMSADRAPYIDQSQSLNLFVAKPTAKLLTTIHFYGWKKGLKTGMYYLRSKPVADAIQFTQPTAKRPKTPDNDDKVAACSRENKDNCLMCSS